MVKVSCTRLGASLMSYISAQYKTQGDCLKWSGAKSESNCQTMSCMWVVGVTRAFALGLERPISTLARLDQRHRAARASLPSLFSIMAY